MISLRRLRDVARGTEAALLARAVAVRMAEARGLTPLEDDAAHRLASALPDLGFAGWGAEMLGRVYEAFLPAAQRRHSGVHYTPPEVAAFLVARVGEGACLLDPACGAGVFLLEAVRRRRGSEVRGMDRDRDAVGVAIEALALETGAGDAGGARRFWSERILAGDALRAELPPADAVVGNPPFFAATGRADLQAWARERFPEVYSGRNDVSHFFVARALELLPVGGRLGLVLPGYVLENTFAQGVRRLLADRTASLEIVDLQSTRLFGANVHAILLVAERGRGGGCRRLVLPEGVPRARVLADLKRLADGESAAVLRPASFEPSALLERIAEHPSLETLCEIDKGCESGRNDVFVLSRERARALGIEEEILRPLLKGRHVARFRLADSGRVLLYLDGRTPLARYPRATAYLEPHREELSRRADCRDGVYPWWRLHRPRGPHLAAAVEKLVVPYRAAAPVFAVDRCGALNDGGDVRFLVPHGGVSADYLCGVLNSAVVRLWSAWRGKRKGRLFEFFREPLARIPVPHPGNREAERIAALARAVAAGAEESEELDRRVAAAYGVGLEEVAEHGL
jgi:adenine-specific DNA-methyltransferase